MSWNLDFMVNELELSIPDKFYKEILSMPVNKRPEPFCYDYVETVVDCRDEAFNPDHMEWCGQWLFFPDEEIKKLLKKHKVTGLAVWYSDGDDRGIHAFYVKDGDVRELYEKLFAVVDKETNEVLWKG